MGMEGGAGRGGRRQTGVALGVRRLKATMDDSRQLQAPRYEGLQ